MKPDKQREEIKNNLCDTCRKGCKVRREAIVSECSKYKPVCECGKEQKELVCTCDIECEEGESGITNSTQCPKHKPIPAEKKEWSACHKATVRTEVTNNGARYYYCEHCGRPCDLAEKKEEKVYTQHEMNEACRIRDLQIIELTCKLIEPEPKPKDRIKELETFGYLTETGKLIAENRNKINQIIRHLNERKVNQ